MTRVLVVEDEESISDPLAYLLRQEGFEVAVASTGLEGLAEFERSGADIVLLDVMLPGLSGTEVCRALRARSSVPVIMLTARDSEIDKVVGLELGADDYVTKPFSSRELVARVRALLRRVERRPGPQDEARRVGVLEVDGATRRVRVRGEEVHLTPTEFDLLGVLSARPGVVRTRDQLLAEVWGWRDGSGPRTVDSHVRGLRRKLGPGWLRTVHGVGYALEAAA